MFNNRRNDNQKSKAFGILMGIIAIIALFSSLPPSLRILTILGVVGGLCYWIYKKYFKETISNKNTDHGSAGWATPGEFLRAGNGESEGLWIGNGHIRKKQGHLITIAGSGQGKGTCLIIPSLLLNPFGSYVITDPKGENAFITAKWQKDAGQNVYILDPWDEQKRLNATHGIPASGFNPFEFIKMEMDELRDSCEQVASFLVPDKPENKDPYWQDRARTMIKTFLMHIITAYPPEEHNFWTLYKLLRLSGKAWVELLFEMKDNEAQDGLINIAAEEFLGIDEAGPTMAGIRSTAQNATTIFESPQLRRSLEKNDFNPYKLTDGNCSVYIVIPERYLETHSVWLRLIIGLCLRACNAKPNKRVNFILDEFAIMGKMRDIQKGYAFARGQNVVLWFFAQSLSQIKEIYGDDGMNTFISNAAVFQAFGVKDHYTTEYISKMLGDATRVKAVKSHSYSRSVDGSSNSQSTSYESYGRRLLTSDEVETNYGIITVAEGLRYLIDRVPYYKSRFANIDIKNDKSLTAEQRKLLKQGRKPEEWYDTFKKRAQAAPRVFS